ncbi:putative UCP018005 [Crocosphaera subtropica ATCC 51142]|uniref:4-dimethylallyltryptophan N-methyltransferase n=1 Tax=Crocosphaera subtropica (strain ATCC 51142 / BH68) TaxID=43989 RepID=B1WTS7_CROS5|nr:L-histidine N(alpha)-methyltransferase [Crocosphaera subtropica]ACB50393.1 putative UCP018005 [Crocosphaera subtropica ATCC 51142]
MLTQLQTEQLKIEYLQPLETVNKLNNSLGQDVKEGLTQCPKKIPSKYFYDDQGSQLFEQICELPEYYPTRTEASILRQYAEEIAQITGNCELVELGSGSSTKTRLLLDAYDQQNDLFKYMPIDVSAGILKESAIQLQQEYSSLKIQGLVGTYDQALTQLKSTSWSARMIFFLGSSIGNFSETDYDNFLNKIAKVLEKGDYFLLGVDLQKPRSILEAAYNDSQGVTAAFNLNMLSHLNHKFQGNFDLNCFKHQAIYNEEKHQIEMYLESETEQRITFKNLDLTVNLERKEKILTEISRKFDVEQTKHKLASKQLKPVKVFTDKNQWFALILCQACK